MNTIESFKRAMVVGVSGILAVFVYSTLATHFNFPSMDFHGFIARAFNLSAGGAWLIYLAVGVGLAYGYRFYFRERMPARTWMRGLAFMFYCWIFMQVILMPLLGFGFFSESFPIAMGMLLAMSVYGATVGYLYEKR